MKKNFILFFTATAIMFTGCLDTTQEITLNEDGTGTYVNTNDLGKIITIAKNMGAASNEKIPQAIDTSFSFATTADSISDLSAEDRELLKKGGIQVKLSLDDEQFTTKMSFPFSSLDEIKKFNRLSGKMMMETMKTRMPSDMNMGGQQMPEPSSFDDYYTLEFSKDELKKKLNKDKYANVDSDEFLSGMKQASAMGIPVVSTYVINLPRPAEKVEGKKAKLSEDKMKVTVKVSMEDFFDNPESLEFKIKY